MPRHFQAGIARRIITPPRHVELAGLGYYLHRTGERLRDNLNATALVITEGENAIAIVAVDLMYNDVAFTHRVREQAAAATNLKLGSICVNFSHSHNAPTAGLILGGGERDQNYLEWAADETAAAIIEAWKKRTPARLSVGKSELSGMTFNRTRENGLMDTQVGVLRAETTDGRPLAVAVNFHSHCTAHMEVDRQAISRDWPGELVDQIESTMPGVTAMYLQGTCGDVNFRREYNGTERRFEPARALTAAAFQAIKNERPVEESGLSVVNRKVTLPTRRWTHEEIQRDRDEGLHRLKTGDISGWMDGVARVCVNQPERLPLRYGGSVEKAVAAVSRFAIEWTDLILPDLETRPELIEAEVQTLRIGDLYLVANPSELFTSTGLEVRKQWGKENLFMLGYSNGSIGYLPDAYDVERRSYAAIQSAKFTGQFPFTATASKVMSEA